MGAIQQLFQGTESLEITHNDPELTFAYANGRERTLFTDGRKLEMSAQERGVDAAIKAQWDGGNVVVVTETNRGDKIIETYEYVAEGPRIVLTVQLENERFDEPVEIRHVYDPAGSP